MNPKNKTPFLSLIFCLSFSFITPSCIIDTGFGSWFGDDFSTLASVSSLSLTSEPDSHWFYIDLDEDYYTNQNKEIPPYEINTTEEYGDTRSGRPSTSGPDGISPSNCEIEFDPDIDFTEQENKDTYCILDIPEHELFIKDLALVYNIPDGMCHSVETHFPWHFNQEAGVGPSTVYKCEIQILTGTNEDGDPQCSTEERYFLNSIHCPTEAEESDCPTPREKRSKSRKDIKEFCAKYDKSDQDGKGNCCFGDYVVINPLDGDAEVENGEWGGDLKECIGGPARTSWNAFTEEGLPVPIIHLSEEKKGFRAKFQIKNICDATGGVSVASIPVTNYIESLDVEASRVPSKVESLRTGTNPLLSVNRETSFVPYYFFSITCLDPAAEVLHAFHLMVQDWSTYGEFRKHWLAKGGDKYDPNVTGEEGPDCDYEEGRLLGSTYYPECNDYLDLDDFSSVALPPNLPYDETCHTE